ncbi:MAG: hypothetical protein NW217_05625 [Hyphomicrobiaceae bacterium]|nr:hypothetical protein [Hyphomicrobiaceae bacterium]
MTAARRIGVALAALTLSVWLGPASAADPKVPAGLDPGGTAVALVSTGVDYTDPVIAARLARDGEGEAIALDLVDGDIRPFSPAVVGEGTRLAKALLSAYRNSRLIIVRAATSDANSVARALMFLAQTPAVVVALDVPAGLAPISGLLVQASRQLKRPLIIAPADALAAGAVVGPALLTVAPAPLGGAGATAPAGATDAWISAAGATMFPGLTKPSPDRLEAAALMAGLAACALHGTENTGAAGDAGILKRDVLGLARPASEGAGVPVHDPMCWYGGIRN